MPMPSTDLTPEQQADARRLAATLDDWKRANPRANTQRNLALACGWTQTTISQYKHGVIPLNLAAALKISRALAGTGHPVSLLDISPSLARQLPDGLANPGPTIQVEEASNTSPWPQKDRGIPLISMVKAGDWAEVEDVYSVGDAEEWIPSPGGHGPRAFFLRVEGESMENPAGPQSFREGELILVDPDRQPRHRSFVIARVNDTMRATFKQLIEADGERYLKADYLFPYLHKISFM